MTRLEALERVVEAARNLQHWQPDRMTQPAAAFEAWGKLNNAILALRFTSAIPPSPAPVPGRTVTLAVWENTATGEIQRLRAGSAADKVLAIVTPPSTVAALVDALDECANDLAELVEAQYGRSKDYTSMRVKYERDMQPVHRARHAIALYRGEGGR